MCLPALSIYAHSIAPSKSVFKGQDLGILLGIAGGLLIFLLWITYQGRMSDKRTQLFLFIVSVTWVYSIARTQFDGSLFNVTFFLLPEIALLIGLKGLTKQSVQIGGLCLAYSLIFVALLNLVLAPFGIGPDGFHIADSAVTRLPIITDLLGLDTRWGGPFGSVNIAGPIGGFIFVYGFTQVNRTHKFALIFGGGTFLLLSQARTSVMAVIIALAIYFLWSPRICTSLHRVQVRISVFTALFVGFLVYIVLLDPTLNGRIQIWQDFLALWRTEPLLGVGSNGVSTFVQNRLEIPGLITHNHAHSVLIDGLMRYGLIMLILTLVILSIAIVVGITALPSIGPSSLAITFYVISAGLTETIFDWIYWGALVAPLFLAVLLGATSRSEEIALPQKEPIPIAP